MAPKREGVPEEFVKGDDFMNKMDYTMRLRVDPHGHIFYWNSDSSVLNAKESTKKPLHALGSGQLCSYAFFDDVVDVRVVDKDETKAKFLGYRYVMVVVTNKDFVHPRMFEFKHFDKKLIAKWEAFIMAWAYKLKKEHHGVTYHLQKILSPHIYCCPSDSISMHTIIDALSPKTRQNSSNHQIVDDVIHDFPFRDQTSAPVLIKKSLLDENVLADLIISACKLAPKMLLTSPQGKVLRDLFASLSKNGVLSSKAFGDFLNETQRDPRLNEEAHKKVFAGTVNRMCRKYSTNRTDSLDFRGFLRFLLSDDNVEMSSKRFDYDETTLSHPLSAYYINSSHNTYQIDEQIGGHADVEIYRQVLLSGCRCIELDCWDDGDEIAILHGISLSTQVSFRDVCHAIKESAFKTSDLPVLLSIENHCKKANQKRMAQIFMEIFGDLLLTEALQDHPLEPGVQLPSPDKLRRKILIKGKKSNSPLEVRSISRSDTASSQLSEIFDDDTEKIVPQRPVLPYPEVYEHKPKREVSPRERRPTLQRGNEPVRKDSPRRLRTSSIPESTRVIKGPDLPWIPNKPRRYGMGMEIFAELDEEDQKHATVTLLREVRNPMPFVETPPPLNARHSLEKDSAVVAEREYKNSVVVTDSTLSSLINYLQTMSPREKENAKIAKKYDVHYKMRSESETALQKDEFSWFALFNICNLTRIYPKGARILSDNYNPYKLWACGCQLVALNFQTPDVPMQLNQTLFEENGRCGYVLKPKCFRDRSVKIDYCSDRITGVIPDVFEVTVIGAFMLSWMGLNDQFKPMVSHVQVGLYDMPMDTVSHSMSKLSSKHCTPKRTENGLVTIYSKEGSTQFSRFVFKEVIKPEFAFVYFNVVDSTSNKCVAQRFLPIHKLQPGYRFVVLRNSANRSAGPACLLVHMKVKHYVAPTSEVLADQFARPLDAQATREELIGKFTNPLEFDYPSDLV